MKYYIKLTAANKSELVLDPDRITEIYPETLIDEYNTNIGYDNGTENHILWHVLETIPEILKKLDFLIDKSGLSSYVRNNK